MSWFEKLIPTRATKRKEDETALWVKCDKCESTLYKSEIERQLWVCSKCNHHMRLSGRARLLSFLDEDGIEELAVTVSAEDSLRFKDTKRYADRLAETQQATEEKDAMVVMAGRLLGRPLVTSAFDFNFMGGSMGSVVGEKFTQGASHAIEKRLGYVCFCTSGGARMQESMHSLMQMAKTSAILKKMQHEKLPFISILTDPTMGGVSASLAMLGDVIIAEPKALIGFAGPRVIEQTVRQTLPEGFQRSEFLLEHGNIDVIVERKDLRQKVFDILNLLQ